jgi:hypothetical protein
VKINKQLGNWHTVESASYFKEKFKHNQLHFGWEIGPKLYTEVHQTIFQEVTHP